MSSTIPQPMTHKAGPTRTTEVALPITCPSWCRLDPADHAADLWHLSGCAIHYSPEVEIPDPTRGPGVGSLDDPNPADTVSIAISSETSPEGKETAAPSVWIEGHQLSVEQVEALAGALTDLIATYRAAGGVA